MEAEIEKERRVSLMGLGMMLALGGMAMLGLWLMVPLAIEGPSMFPPQKLPQVIISLNAIMVMSLIGYVLGRDMDVLKRLGQPASRAVTLDWLWRGMVPFVAYVLASAVPVNVDLHFRHAAFAEAGLAFALGAYGLAMLMTSVNAQRAAVEART